MNRSDTPAHETVEDHRPVEQVRRPAARALASQQFWPVRARQRPQSRNSRPKLSVASAFDLTATASIGSKPQSRAPASPDWLRPPHSHFERHGQFERLVTQMYFPDEPLNAADRLLNAALYPDLLVATCLPPQDPAGSRGS